MKKSKKIKGKILSLSLAALLPVASGAVLSLNNVNKTRAATNTPSYAKSFVQEVSMTNNNFNSSSSAYSLSTSLSGWTGQQTDRKTTAGIINTGNSFQDYMTGTFHLSKNPSASGADKHVLMINSKTDSSNNYKVSKQGYKSSSVSLSANSFYSFQVAFKTDTNYESDTLYPRAGTIGEDTDGDFSISATSFSAKPFDLNGDDVYIAFSGIKNRTHYVIKKLNMTNTITIAEALDDVETFYEDDNFYGVMYQNDQDSEIPVYINKNDTDSGESTEDAKINIHSNATAYTCDEITYTPGQNNPYKISSGTPFFTSKTSYNPINSDTRGSIYLSGLTDKDGNPVKAEYVAITSKEWVTFYFFVATGNNSHTVNLELWLGAKNLSSSGVVFFDDCHVMQYSENAFWKTYNTYFGIGYQQQSSDSFYTQHCTQFIDLREDKSDVQRENNFDFEDGTYNSDVTSLKNWKKDENCGGKAQIFDVNDPVLFKARTGYNFVGSNFACDVVLQENNEDGLPRAKVVAINENRYVLGLWAEDDYVKVTSNDIDIASKEIYKITAQYKISEIKSGNAFLSISENDKVLGKYNLTKEQYTLATETSSAGVSSNAQNNFSNNYGTIEFYVKGGALIDSSVNISLSLGNETSKATGCIVFDNIKVESATSEAFNSATNKLTLGGTSDSETSGIPNGEFDLTTSSENSNGLFSPESWTLTKGDGLTFAGVANTDEHQYSKYRNLFKENEEGENSGINNPYLWASWQNPTNRFGENEPDNILILGNMTQSWQKVKSDNISVSANTAYKLSFNYKTFNYSQEATPAKSQFTVSVYGEEGFLLYKSKQPISSDTWKEHSIYLNSFSGASKIYLEIDFGTSNDKISGLAYFDHFTLESGVNVPSGAECVDMSDFCLNLQSNNLSSDIETSNSPAYTGTVTSGNGNGQRGGIVTGEFFNENSRFHLDNANNNKFFYISITGGGSYTIQSNFNIDLETDHYYVLTFKLKTFFNHLNKDVSLDKDKTYNYGATLGLTGFDYMTGLKSNEDYTEYKLFIKPTETASAKLYMALVCDSPETSGSMVIYDLKLTENEDEYNSAVTTTGNKKYDINQDKVFVAKANDSSDTETPDTDSSETESAPSNGFNWLLIPTLITALAIVIAVVGYFLRKVKIKKIEIKRKESYDRKHSANADIIKREALAERDAEVSTLEKSKEKFENELKKLEQEHKQKVVALREKDTKEVSKETDKEFKLFAKKRTVLAEKIDALNKQIEEIKTPEHLLSLERKFYAEQENRRRELEKISKKEEKEKQKKSKNNNKDKKDA